MRERCYECVGRKWVAVPWLEDLRSNWTLTRTFTIIRSEPCPRCGGEGLEK